MNMRKLVLIVVTGILLGSVVAVLSNQSSAAPQVVATETLSNVHDYLPASTAAEASYVVNDGELYVGGPAQWTQVNTPQDVQVSAMAIDRSTSEQNETLYVGSATEANGIAIYRSVDGGQNWTQYLLADGTIGMVTDIAVDNVQNLVYVATDTAGLFRLRDVGSALLLNAQLQVDEPVLEVVVAENGSGLAFARTQWHLYRAEAYGLQWVTVDNLESVPTAVAIANTNPATIYVGTVSRGLLKSEDNGYSWSQANAALSLVPGARLSVDALAINPTQPNALYVATSYLHGSTQVHRTPSSILMSRDNAQSWSAVDTTQTAGLVNPTVLSLFAVGGENGSLYAKTTQMSGLSVVAGTPDVVTTLPATPVAGNTNGWLAWIIAGLAALVLLVMVASDVWGKMVQQQRKWTLASSHIAHG